MGTNLPSLYDLIEDYLLCCITEGKSPRTIEWYSSNLGRFNRYLESQGLSQSARDIGRAEVRRFIFHLETEVTRWETNPAINDTRRLSPVSIQGYARAIRAFWSWLLDEGYIDHNPMVRLTLPKVPERVIATFGEKQIESLLGELDTRTPVGFRNHVIVLILLDTGIRLSELVGLTVDSIDLVDGNDSRMIQLVGEDVTEDNLLEALEGADAIFTYNGSRFDLPFIRACLGLDLAVMFHHHDLMYDCWRNNLYGGFKLVEAQLGISRQLMEITGAHAVVLWWRYQNYGDQNALAMLLQYNKEDVVNLKALREKVT